MLYSKTEIVKKLLTVQSITYGGVNNQFATVTCENSHGLLVGDQVTVYGANPILYNGSFAVTSRDSATVFQYQLVQPAEVTPQGNILVSVTSAIILFSFLLSSFDHITFGHLFQCCRYPFL